MNEIEKKDDIRVITYTKGQDYRVIYNEIIDKNDIFYNQYIKAFRLLNNIVVSNYAAKENKDNYIEEAKNIIGFCGERGQGKTTAMIRFKNMLENLNKKKDISTKTIEDLKERYKNEYKLDHEKFYCLDIIDPSKFEDFSSILDIVVLKIYNDIKKDMSNERSNNDYDDLRKALDRAYKSICLFKNPKECISKQYDLDFGITKLSIISENMKVRENISTLVDEYLKFKSNATSAANKYLVISIDDLDLDTKRSYEISEEIRKYLDCDNIIVIMAVRSKQLLYSVEREFLDDYKIMLNEKVIDEGEIHKMAYKYVDKLLPERNRIHLPKLNSKFDIAKLKIKYIENEKNQCTDKNIESFILNLIYEKTGMIFYQKEEIHPIIPDTLRELISLLSFLTDLDDIGKRVNTNNYFMISENNIELFEDYFFNHWVNDNFNNKERLLLNELRYSRNEEFNYIVIKSLDENLASDKNEQNIAIGDVFNTLIATKEINKGIVNKTNFITALKIILTIRIHKNSFEAHIYKDNKESIEYNKKNIEDYIEILGDNIFVGNLEKKFMYNNHNVNSSNYKFLIDYDDYLKNNKSNKSKKRNLLRKNYDVKIIDDIVEIGLDNKYYVNLDILFYLSVKNLVENKGYGNFKYAYLLLFNVDLVILMLKSKNRAKNIRELNIIIKNIANTLKVKFDSVKNLNDLYIDERIEKKYDELKNYQTVSKIEYFKYKKYEELKNNIMTYGYIKRQERTDCDKNIMFLKIIYILRNYGKNLYEENKILSDIYEKIMVGNAYVRGVVKKNYIEMNENIEMIIDLFECDNYNDFIKINPNYYFKQNFKDNQTYKYDVRKKILNIIRKNRNNKNSDKRCDRITVKIDSFMKAEFDRASHEDVGIFNKRYITLERIEQFVEDVDFKSEFHDFIQDFPMEFLPYENKLSINSDKAELYYKIANIYYVATKYLPDSAMLNDEYLYSSKFSNNIAPNIALYQILSEAKKHEDNGKFSNDEVDLIKSIKPLYSGVKHVNNSEKSSDENNVYGYYKSLKEINDNIKPTKDLIISELEKIYKKLSDDVYLIKKEIINELEFLEKQVYICRSNNHEKHK